MFYNKLTRILFVTVLSLLPALSVFADQCPAPNEIIDRKISRIYEWTVDEKTSLNDLESVKQLYSVRIMNYGEYISCRYSTDKWPVTLDAKPVGSKCSLSPEEGEWTGTDSGHLVCQEKNLYKCGFKIVCKTGIDRVEDTTY